ncbi:MAG TPA: hypothetical protein VFG69_01405 [Nannocystaceae bacterium]|nr:hypothetical protein [Nannocystaceae bacterium]
MLEIAVVAVVSLVALGGSVVFGLRVSASAMKEQRARVAAVNAALRALATRADLELVERKPHRHPLVGDVRCYATVAGTYRGHALRVEVESDEDTVRIVVNVTADEGDWWPNLGALKPARDHERHPHLAFALAELERCAAEIRVAPATIRVVPRTDDDLVAAVDAAVALADALSPGLPPR